MSVRLWYETYSKENKIIIVPDFIFFAKQKNNNFLFLEYLPLRVFVHFNLHTE